MRNEKIDDNFNILNGMFINFEHVLRKDKKCNFIKSDV